MRIIQIYLFGVIFLVFAGCAHLSKHSGDINQLVQVWPTNANYQGIAIMALLGDDVKISEGEVIDLPETDGASATVQFAIGNAFHHDIRLKVSTRFDLSGHFPATITLADISSAEAAALVADEDSPYLWLSGTDGTGLRPPGFNSRGMTWQVPGATLAIPKEGTLTFRRIFVLDFYIRDKGKHYLIEYPFECSFRRS